jgi:hypothetical protein
MTWLVSCASPGAGSARLSDLNVITRYEMDNSGARSAYDVVQSLRPQWLRIRGLTNLAQTAGVEDIVIYLDNARLGYREAMRRVALGPVQFLRFFTAPEATQRWGAGHLHGAILISTQSP